MRSLRCPALVLLCGLSFVGPASGQAAKKQAPPFVELFQELDTNRDRAIERDEVPPAGRDAFDRLLRRGDDNHNGKLEAEEYRAVLLDLREFNEQARQKAVGRFKSMDRDGDGKVTRDEFTGPKPRFDLLDRNADGHLTESEFLTPVSAKAQARKAATPAKTAPAKKDADPSADDAKKPAANSDSALKTTD